MRRSVVGTLIVLLSVTCGLPAQNASPGTTPETKPVPLQISDYRTVMSHRLSETEPLRVASRPQVLFNSVRMEIVVDEQGNVVSAKIEDEKADDAHQKLYAAALVEARNWKYKPFEKDSNPVSAIFTDYVRILPVEDLPKVHVPFPQIKEWGTLRITLERTTCFGACPAYHIEIRGDGTVVYQGHSYVVVTGEHHDSISKESLGQILEAFRKADYFSLRDKYIYGVTDNPTTTTSIAFDGNQKSVIDYVGEEAGMPHAVEELEETIDRVTGSAKWIIGNTETVSSLMRENWNFKSVEAGQTVVRAACDRRHLAPDTSEAALRDLVAAGAPPNEHDQRGRSALACMAEQKNEEAVLLLMEAGAARSNPAVKNEALAGAAQAGDLQLVRLMLKYGADPNAALHKGETALMAAAASGKPDVVAEILKYHPDVNARGPDLETALYLAGADRYFQGPESERETFEKQRTEVIVMLMKAGADPHLADKDGNTPLHKARERAIAEALIKSGADVNARNKNGETPLMVTYSGDIARLLLQAGADISARDNQGKTALDTAHFGGFEDKMKVLQAAQNASAGKADK